MIVNILWKFGKNSGTNVLDDTNVIVEYYSGKIDEKTKLNADENFQKISPQPEVETESFDAEEDTNEVIKAEIVEDEEVPTCTADEIEIKELDFYCSNSNF